MALNTPATVGPLYYLPNHSDDSSILRCYSTTANGACKAVFKIESGNLTFYVNSSLTSGTPGGFKLNGSSILSSDGDSLSAGDVVDVRNTTDTGSLGTFTVPNPNTWISGGTSTESLNTGVITQNLDGSLSFQVDASSDASETYSIALDGVNDSSIVPTGVGPWYQNYTFAEHTAVGYGTWTLYDQNSILDSILTTASATPSTPSTSSSTKKVHCNFW